LHPDGTSASGLRVPRDVKVATWEVQIVDAGTEANGLAKDEVVFGTPGGRESFGGIIRDAYAEIRPSSFVENVRFDYRFVDGYGKAKCCRINIRVGVQLRETTACSNACATARCGYVFCVSNCFGKTSGTGSKKVSVGRSGLWMARSSESQARRVANGGFCTASDFRVWCVTFSR
jgi:hypothetical protein